MITTEIISQSLPVVSEIWGRLPQLQVPRVRLDTDSGFLGSLEPVTAGS
ncbi:MAG: hypothetical protein N0E39_12880 [Candidatus Thiodiazotropha lotti]|nr:hypothetical protein [Candidatus Thiodiazotropha lotti]